jgi:hypothetical protein
LGLIVAERLPSRLRFHGGPRWADCTLWAGIGKRKKKEAGKTGATRKVRKRAGGPYRRAYSRLYKRAASESVPYKDCRRARWKRRAGVGRGGLGVLGFCCEKRPGKAPRKSQRRVRSLPPVHFLPSGRESFLCRPAGKTRGN